MAAQAADPGAGQSRRRRSCPRRCKAVRPDAIIATGRSRLPQPGQQRPVLPVHLPRRAGRRRHHHQRGDEDRRGARRIAELAHGRAASDVVAAAYGGEDLCFGPDYLIPKPFDPRLIVQIAPAVAKAAMDIGRRHAGRSPISTPTAASWSSSSTTPALLMQPVFAARQDATAEARRLRRGRGRAGAARRAGRGRRRPGAARS